MGFFKEKYRITILIHYFGTMPEWADIYFETLKRNSTIQFIVYSNNDLKKYITSNIQFVRMDFEQYLEFASEKIGIKLNFKTAYKLCDLRPFFGKIHSNEIKKSDFYGYADIDVIFGDIRNFYSDSILSKYDVFSTHEHTLSGHFSLFRNTNLTKNMFKFIGGYETKLNSEGYVGMDESYLYNAFLKYNKETMNFNEKSFFFIKKPILNFYFKEQYTTPFTPYPWIDQTINSAQPENWFYTCGQITNDRDNRNFMYLHFMNFKSSQYRHDNTKAPWEGKNNFCRVSLENLNEGISINCEGIIPLN